MVAIFGAKGYLGRHLEAYFQKAGEDVDCYDCNNCDVTNASFWETFDATRYTSIMFFAGLSGPERSFQEAERYLMVNEYGLLFLLKKLSRLGQQSPLVIFPSSRLVYRGGGTVTEESPIEPRSVYGANKVACEGLLAAYYHRFGIPYSALRICVPFGNYLGTELSYGTIGFFSKMAKEGKSITVYGDGSVSKTYTDIMDICEIAYRMHKKRSVGVFNIGGHDYSLMEAARIVAGKFHGSVSCVPWPVSALKVEMGSISLKADKLAAAIGFGNYRRLEDCILG